MLSGKLVFESDISSFLLFFFSLFREKKNYTLNAMVDLSQTSVSIKISFVMEMEKFFCFSLTSGSNRNVV